jgi:tRNA uridine 5-carboxymethylaminomethyl modification enzyme
MPTYHAIILATCDQGRTNLYNLISLSHITYFNRRPRIPKSEFIKYRNGLLLGSACEAGELYRAILGGRPEEEISRIVDFINNYSIKPAYINEFLEKNGTTALKNGCKLVDLVMRPQLNIELLTETIPALKNCIEKIKNRKEEILEAAEIQIKYKGYIERETLIANKLQRLENIKIKGKFDYSTLQSLSTEARQKLEKIDPETIGQASRIPGISPSDINILLILMGR